MAYSSSIQHAQVIKLCEFCEENNIKWRCTDCEQSICDKCRNIHLRARGTSHHQVVTITTPIKEVQHKIITDNIPCKDHKSKMTCLFCKTCDCLVCTDCVVTHKKHLFVPIDSVLEEKLDNIKKIQSDISDKIKVCESQHSEIGIFKTEYNSVYNDSMEKIKEREKELIDAIMKYSKVLQDDLKVERSKFEKTASKIEKEISKTKKKLALQKDEVEAILTSNKGKLILEFIGMIPEVNIDPLLNTGKHFIPGEITKQTQELFGSLQNITTPSEQQDIQFEIQRTYTTGLDSILKIIALDETSAWISSYSEIRKVKIVNDNIKTSKEISLSFYDMALTNNENILIIQERISSDIRVLTKSGKLKLFIEVAPLITLGIPMAKSNDIMVCVREQNDPYRPAVIVYGMDGRGKEKHRYQYDNYGKKLFTSPHYIATNNNHDILVIDHTGKCDGRVVCLDRKGSLRWVYEGLPEFNVFARFDPQGLATTSAGQIIVSDFSAHALHVLSKEGNVLTCKVVKDMGIEYPCGLDIDKGGNLWIGYGDNGELAILKLKNVFLSE